MGARPKGKCLLSSKEEISKSTLLFYPELLCPSALRSEPSFQSWRAPPERTGQPVLSPQKFECTFQ
jgi:hypothetical protein